MSEMDPTVSDKIIVEELDGLSNQEQAEAIANQFGRIANMYEPLPPV